MKSWRVVVAVAAALSSASAGIPQGTPPAATTRAEQLELAADFFVPVAMIFAVGRELCDTAFRTELAGDPELPAVEERLPGLSDRMVKTAAALCDVEMKALLKARQDQVRSDMAALMSPAELARMAKLVARAVQQTRDLRIEVRPGYTMQQIASQATTTPQQELQLREAQIAFARTPGGIPILEKVQAYSAKVRPLIAQDQGALKEIAKRAYLAAHREANLYAQQKGVRELYADAPVPPLPPAQAAAIDAATMKLPGSFVYVYSFLDVRKDEYTPKVLAQFDADLVARLRALGISSKVFHFTESSRSQEEFFANKVTDGAQSQSRMIPVGETIDGNVADERAAKARFRLVIFPDNFTLAGAWRFYDIRFMLMDIASGRTILEYAYSGKHMVILKNSENAEARSRKILDGAFAEMRAKGAL